MEEWGKHSKAKLPKNLWKNHNTLNKLKKQGSLNHEILDIHRAHI